MIKNSPLFLLLIILLLAACTNPTPILDDTQVVVVDTTYAGKTEVTIVSSATATIIQPTLTIQTDIGTVENPQEDVDKIIGYVTELLTKQEDMILGQSGWIHIQYEEFHPVALRGNGSPVSGISVTAIFPDDIIIHEEWYLVDEEGFYQQRIEHTRTVEGQILQRTVIIDGTSVNLTMQDADPNHEKSDMPFIREKMNLDRNLMYMLQMASEQESEISAWRENGEYIVTFTQWYEEYDKFMNSEELILGSQDKYTFNINSGVFVSSELRLNDGESWFVLEQISKLTMEKIDQLPNEAAYSLIRASE